MDLTQEQKDALTRWVKEGIGLSGIQRNLSDEFGMRMTYMDVRFLVMDLGLTVKEKVVRETPAEVGGGAPGRPSAVPEAGDLADAPRGAGTVSVDLDRVMRPGSLVSGTVTFSDGASAKWVLDQFGRLALEGGKQGYTPSHDDVESFQTQLRALLEKRGL